MNIILFESESGYYPLLIESLDKNDNNIYLLSAPENDNKYLSDIMEICKEVKVDCISSIGYYRELSLAAGVMGMKYVFYIFDGYDEKVFDNTVINEWNTALVIDKVLYETLLKLNVKTVLYDEICLKKNAEAKKNTGGIYISKAVTKNDFYNALSAKTKGYLDGFMAVLRQSTAVCEIYASLPKEIRNEIKETAGEKPEWFIESEGLFYDYHFLFPLLSQRELLLYEEILASEGIKTVDYKDAKYVVSVPERRNGTAPSYFEIQSLLDGKKIIAVERTDYKVIHEKADFSFKDRFDFTNIIRHIGVN